MAMLDNGRDSSTVKYPVGTRVLFEFDPGKERIGKIINVAQQPGWTAPQYQIQYRGSLSWRHESEIQEVTSR